MKPLVLAAPRGFCAGVKRALDIVELALAKYGAPVYVRNQIVHNDHVVAALEARGVVFVKELAEVAPGRPVVFSAHGVSQAVEDEARSLSLTVVDATCPLVKRVHREAERRRDEGCSIVLVGHPGHPEIVGTLGRAGSSAHVVETVADVAALPGPDSMGEVACLTQTTLSAEDIGPVWRALSERYGAALLGRGNICYASQDRQEAVGRLAAGCDVVFVLGSARSSNSNRLREVAERRGARAYLVGSADDVTDAMLEGAAAVGISAGASAPEELVQELVTTLCGRGWGAPSASEPLRPEPGFPVPELP